MIKENDGYKTVANVGVSNDQRAVNIQSINKRVDFKVGAACLSDQRWHSGAVRG